MADLDLSANAPKPKSVAGWFFGGLSFIPAIGVLFGIIAIIIGAVKRIKGPIFLGIAGILFSVLLYGGLFYFAVVAKTGPYADLKVKLVSQTMNIDAGRIALYKSQHATLPASLGDLGTPSQTNMVFTTDPWGTPLKYVPESDGHFQLISAGPDRTFGTSDDITQTF